MPAQNENGENNNTTRTKQGNECCYPYINTQRRKEIWRCAARWEVKATYHQNTKHLRNQPPVTRHTIPVLHQFTSCPLDIVHDIAGASSIRWIISDCSLTICASWPKIRPNSPIIRSMASIASPRAWIYELPVCASSMTSSCRSDCMDGQPRGDGFESSRLRMSWPSWNPVAAYVFRMCYIMGNRTSQGRGRTGTWRKLRRRSSLFSNATLGCSWFALPALLWNWLRHLLIFLGAWQLSECVSSVHRFCQQKSTLSLCSSSWSAFERPVFGCCDRVSACNPAICWLNDARSWFDNISQFGDLDGPAIEKCLPFGHYIH